MVSWPGRKKSAPTPAASVHFTPAAREQVLQVLGREGGPGVAALRLSVKNPGAGAPQYDMALEQVGAAGPQDTVVDAGGFSVVVDAASLPEVNGATVDFVDDPLRPGFRVDPPQPEVPSGGRSRPRCSASRQLPP